MRLHTVAAGLALVGSVAVGGACSSAGSSSPAGVGASDAGQGPSSPSPTDDGSGSGSGSDGRDGHPVGDGGLTPESEGGSSLPACAAVTIGSPPLDFTLPSGFPGDAFWLTADILGCSDKSYPAYTTMDIDGDHIADLVLTQTCADAAVGTSKWSVHKGAPGGFAATASDYVLPSGYGDVAFGASSAVASCSASGGTSTGSPSFAMLDLDSDGLRDLVITQKCDDAAVGTSEWLVHKGGPNGFADASTSYALPTGFGALAFPSFSEVTSCSDATTPPTFGVRDVDGDGAPDLIVTQKCGDASVGNAHWLVFKGSASGFAATPTLFALPAGFPDQALSLLGSVNSCQGTTGLPTFAVLDASGDARPDLVITERCDDAALGATKWQVYLNDGTGFSTVATDYLLPAGYGSLPFSRMSYTGSCSSPGDDPSFFTEDLDRDGIADLVVTRDCAATGAEVGTSKWRVYKGSPSGFAASPYELPLPGGYPTLSFDAAGHSSSCDAGDPFPGYAMLDLDGDRLIDLVVTKSCSDPAVASSKWLVYRGACAP